MQQLTNWPFEPTKPTLNQSITKQKRFLQILTNRSVTTHFQPIYSLTTGGIFGYEALSRCPHDELFNNPHLLFSYAEEIGLLYPLEKLAREKAIELSSDLLDVNQKLLINLNANVIYDPNFTPGHTIALLQQYGLTPDDIIFEITERNAIHDFPAFRDVLTHYRKQGFEIAVDDAGAGYSSLQTISELSPEYIKIDRSLIQGIHQNPTKQHILEAFVSFAKKMNSKVVAEGIEEEEEYKQVLELGIDFAQGYYIARPDYPARPVSHQAVTVFEQHSKKRSLQHDTVEQLVEPATIFPVDSEPDRILSHFLHQSNASAVLIKQEELIYLLEKQTWLISCLKRGIATDIASQMKKPISVAATTTVKEAIQLLAQVRTEDKEVITHLLVLDRYGHPTGIIPVHKLYQCYFDHFNA